jgi:excisionase family DNA binding protein
MRALNLKEAAVFLKLHPATLRQRAAAGRIPAARIGRRWVFLEEDLAAYVRKQYPDQWQALQGEHEESTPCHSTNARARHFGGSDSPTTDAAYRRALGLSSEPLPSSTRLD